MTDSLSGLEEFQESYYGHNCTIHGRKIDVMKTDIQSGNNFFIMLKRWWHGLFLVSYSDERSKLYYKSSEAMRLDRVRQFRFYRGRIHPLSKFRRFWDAFMLTLLIVNEFIVNHNLSYIYGDYYSSFYYIGLTIELFMFVDVIINIDTGYIDNEVRKIVLDINEICRYYCSRKLFLHVGSCIPVQWILYMRHGTQFACDTCKTNYFILALRAVTIFRLYRIYEYSSYWTRERSNFVTTSFYRFVRVCFLGLMTLLYVQDMADKIALMVMIEKNHIDHNSYTSQIIYIKFIEFPEKSVTNLYVVSILRAVRLAMGVKFTAIDLHVDRILTVVSMIITSFFYIWSITEVYGLITGVYFNEAEIQNFKTNAQSLVYCRQLNDSIIPKLETFYDFKRAQMDITELHNNLYSRMPPILKRESALACYGRYVRRLPYFAEWPAPVVEELVLMLKRETYLSNDMVAEPWVPSEGLAIVAVGELAVYSGAEERGHLIDGDCFGELSLVTDHERRTSSVIAITESVILLLDKIPFRIFMRDHQDLFLELKQELNNTFGATKRFVSQKEKKYSRRYEYP